jgi:DNA-binding transcriptional regulator YiaG
MAGLHGEALPEVHEKSRKAFKDAEATMTARQFKRARKLMWKTQAAAAKAFGVEQPSVARWENGINKIPKTILILLNFYLEEFKQRVVADV